MCKVRWDHSLIHSFTIFGTRSGPQVHFSVVPSRRGPFSASSPALLVSQAFLAQLATSTRCMALLGNKGPSTFSLKTSGMPSPSGRGEPYLLKRPNVSFASPSEDLHSKGIWLPKSTTNLSQERLPCCLSASLHFDRESAEVEKSERGKQTTEVGMSWWRYERR